MSINCNYSFADLFRAAHGRSAAASELDELYSRPRDEINRTVREWAVQAGWKTREIRGSDGEMYLAFWPEDEQRSAS